MTARRPGQGDLVPAGVPAGVGDWPIEGVGIVTRIHGGVIDIRGGPILTPTEVRELILAGDRPRPRPRRTSCISALASVWLHKPRKCRLGHPTPQTAFARPTAQRSPQSRPY